MFFANLVPVTVDLEKLFKWSGFRVGSGWAETLVNTECLSKSLTWAERY